MLSEETIDPALKSQIKEQRLKQLQAQWYDMYLQKAGYEANGLTAQAQQLQDRMDIIQKSYDAIAALGGE